MNIALVSSQALPTPPPRYGGLEKIVHDLGWQLSRMGHKVTIFAREGSNVDGCRMFWAGTMDEPPAYDAYKDELKQFDIVHSHTWLGLPNVLRYEGVKVINTYHGMWLSYRYSPPMNIVGISRFHSMFLAGQIGEETRYCYNGISTEDYPLYKGPRSDRLLFLDRLSPEKGIGLAVYLAQKHNWKLDIIGSTFGSDEGQVAFVLQRCDGSQIKYWGELELEMKRELLQQAKGILWLTPTFEEPFGMGIVEANLCGTPVVAMPRGSIPELVSNKFNGYIASQEAEIVAAVEALGYLSPHDCRTMAMGFSREAMTEKYLELYREAQNGGW